MKELSIEETHAVTLEILKKMIEITDKIGINYFVAYGSLIGVVRHKGFIPWDDDLDVIMLRKEYQKFINYCEKNKDDLLPFKILYDYKKTEYPYPIARLIDTRYKTIFSNMKPYGCGAFVDIYPFDGAGSGEKKDISRAAREKRIYKRMLLYSVQNHFEDHKHGLIRKGITYFAYHLAHIIGKKFFLDRLESLGKRYAMNKSSHVACMVWNDKIIPVPKWHFEEYEFMEFENILVKVPKDYDAVLRASYGNYMKLPPEDKRVATHEYRIFEKEVKGV